MFRVPFLVLYGVSDAVFAGLACACMLVSVEFHVAMREVWMLSVGVREEKFPEKKATVLLYLFLPLSVS